ncbi:hypothetical protein NLU13_0662 [Sarocladium strictum]|uniref:Uncharacterized protein n=1 Tax=Sarocladium strictum TaxID=5046 RepID=A0AA39GPR8_SARSR|nr:hypothetical protein NLU13_0662 [Sarocladium strictum]
MSYALQTSYMGESLLSGFNWFNGKDLSNGFVSYQNRSDAEALGLYSLDETTQVVRLGVDANNTVPLDYGRPSIRLESKEAYDHGLFIADFLHMPPSQCGLWPAFWMYGSDWPYGGELDIIEGANTAHRNIISAHTTDGCFQDETSLFIGEQRNTDCAVGTKNIGCGFNPPVADASSYGDAFNAAGGGVYAVQWDSERIKVWHFPRGAIPADIDAKNPQPAGWGLPQAVFGGQKCDVDSYFKNMSIVININFCGDYGDATWASSDTCSSFAPTCDEYVANNPEAFVNAHWDIKYIDAYQLSASSVTPLPATAVPTPVNPSVFPPAPVNPDTIDTFSYLGCFSSGNNFSTFVAGENTPEMTLERCVKSCSNAGHTYAGIFGTQCYCADDLDAGSTRAIENESSCSTPCSGNSTQLCGGGGNSTSSRLFTVYGGVANEEKPLAVPMAGIPSTIKVVICPTATAMSASAVETKIVLPVPVATSQANQTFLKPVSPPTSTPVTAAGVVSLPDWRLGALSSVVVIGFLVLI